MKKPAVVPTPFEQLTAAAKNLTVEGRAKIIKELAAYAETDLLCHRAEAPPELAARQAEVWQPALDWCAKRFGASLCTGAGLMPIAQSKEALQALRRVIEAYDNARLVGLHKAVELSGSLVLGLALAEGHYTAAQAFEASECDASFQMQKWGEDPVTAARRAAIRKDLDVCGEWLRGQSPAKL